MKLSSWIYFLLLFQAGMFNHSLANTIDVATLESRIARFVDLNPEATYIKRWSEKRGIRAWFFGGTATTVALYARESMNDNTTQSINLGSKFGSLQDLDIVIDGKESDVLDLEADLIKRFPHYLPSDIERPDKVKTAWEVRPLKVPLLNHIHPKDSILNNQDFLSRNNDSFSTGLIEITQSDSPKIRDVRAWKDPNSEYLRSIVNKKIRFYRSKDHARTMRGQSGLNPEILSAIRYVIKIVQTGAQFDPTDMATVAKIIRDTKTSAIEGRSNYYSPKNNYVRNWIERNGKKIILGAKDLEYAHGLIEQLDLGRIFKIVNSLADKPSKHSLYNLVIKEPLRTSYSYPDIKSGRTAYYVIDDIKTYEMISKTGNFNVFANDGTVALSLNKPDHPWFVTVDIKKDARVGKDFDLLGSDTVILKNRGAVMVDPTSTRITLNHLLTVDKIRVSELRGGLLLELIRELNLNPVPADETQKHLSKLEEKLKSGSAQFPEILVYMASNQIPKNKDIMREVSGQFPAGFFESLLGSRDVANNPALDDILNETRTNKQRERKLLTQSEISLLISGIKTQGISSSETALHAFESILESKNKDHLYLFSRYGLQYFSSLQRAKILSTMYSSKQFLADEEAVFLTIKYAIDGIPESDALINTIKTEISNRKYEKASSGLIKYHGYDPAPRVASAPTPWVASAPARTTTNSCLSFY